MPSICLASLPTEIVLEILQYLEESPHALRAFAESNKRFNQIVQHVKYIIHQEKAVLYTLESKDGFPQSWLSDVDVLQGIRRLIVHATNRGQLDFAPLIELIERIAQLDTLIWACEFPIPLSVLDSIHKHVAASLVITQYTRDDTWLGKDYLQRALEKSPALTFIQLVRYIDPSSWYSDYFFCMRRTIQFAPNLQGMSILQDPVLGYGKFSPVLPKELRHVQRRELENESRGPPRIGSCGSNRNPCCFSRLPLARDEVRRRWLPAGMVLLNQPRVLERLGISNAFQRDEDVKPAFEKLAGLKEIEWDLRFVPTISCVTLMTHLTNHRPLEVLRLRNWTNRVNILEALSSHGSSLKVLELHNFDETPIRWIAMSPELLTVIKDRCPRLEDLTFDICPSTDKLDLAEHQDLFEILASMRLRNVKIYVELTTFLSVDYIPPRLMSSSEIKPYVGDVWKSIFRNTLFGQNRELNMLFGPFCSEMGKRLSSSWIATACEKDGILGKCIVWCDCSLPESIRLEEVEWKQKKDYIDAAGKKYWQEWDRERREELRRLHCRQRMIAVEKVFKALILRPPQRCVGMARRLLPGSHINE